MINLRVAGIDPGTIRTGIGILEQDERRRITLVHCETIQADRRCPLAERLRTIFGGLKEVLTIYRPSVTAIESVFFHKDFKAAVKIGEARAAAMLAAMEFAIPITEYMPTAIKIAVCGNGHAAKEQVQYMIQKLLMLRETPPPDSADALAAAFCHFHHLTSASFNRLAAASGRR